MTASELMEELNSDPDYKARVAERDRKIERQAAVWEAEEEELVFDLRSAGFAVESVWDFVNTSTPYPAAIPILLDHLQRDYSDRTREGIARALAVRDARGGWNVLVEQFQRSNDTTTIGSKFGLACALGAAGDDSVLDEAVALMSDPRHGQNRLPLLTILERSKARAATEALRQLVEDADLADEARRILAKRGF